jgi:hypothetical protein
MMGRNAFTFIPMFAGTPLADETVCQQRAGCARALRGAKGTVWPGQPFPTPMPDTECADCRSRMDLLGRR